MWAGAVVGLTVTPASLSCVSPPGPDDFHSTLTVRSPNVSR